MKASRREIRFLIVDLLRFKYALESNSYLISIERMCVIFMRNVLFAENV